MYRCILFDMDGTLVNSYEGIFHSYEHTLNKLGTPFAGESFVKNAIGRTLPFVFEQLCGMDREQALHAIQIYRDYYAKQGQYELSAYEGIERMLRTLKQSGKFLGVATLKKEEFARAILKRLGLSSLFDCICGMDEEDTLSKTELLRRCRQISSFPKEETILVGDTISDAAGAHEAGISFLAVTYGFGFQQEGELSKNRVKWIAQTPFQVADFLCEKVSSREKLSQEKPMPSVNFEN